MGICHGTPPQSPNHPASPVHGLNRPHFSPSSVPNTTANGNHNASASPPRVPTAPATHKQQQQTDAAAVAPAQGEHKHTSSSSSFSASPGPSPLLHQEVLGVISRTVLPTPPRPGDSSSCYSHYQE